MMEGFRNVSLKSVEWGKEFKWGIVKRIEGRLISSREDLRPQFYVTESGAAAFTGSRCVATNLTHDEASALCAILNAGESK